MKRPFLQQWDLNLYDIYSRTLHSKIGKLRQWMSNWHSTYMEQPEGFIAQGEEDKVCKLMHSRYGLKQAGWVWNRTFAHTIKRKLGFNTIHSDVGICVLCCHHKWGDSEMDMILILYVDDLSKIEHLKCQLGKLYQMKDLRPASSYLGIWITRDHSRWTIWIDQQVYIENTIKRLKLLDANNTNTPLPAGIHL